MNSASPAQPRARARQLLQDLLAPGVLPLLVLAGGIGLTALLWSAARADAEQEVKAEFGARVRELVNSLDQRMQTYVQVLYGVQGLFASSQEVSRAEFHTYLRGQELNQHFPGVQAVGYMRLVGGAARASHEAEVRAAGAPDYRMTPAGLRPWYAPVTYIEPFDPSNRLAFGFDAASEPLRRAALEQARDTGLPALSASIQLRQDQDGPPQPGFLMVLPLYQPLPGSQGRQGSQASPAEPAPRGRDQRRAAIAGWVYAPFRVADLMAGLGGPRAAVLDIEIYDGARVAPAARMYDSAPGQHNGLHSSIQQITLANHLWTLRVSLREGALPAPAGNARLLATCGILFSALGAWLTWMLARGRLRARAALARSYLLAAELKDGQEALMALADSAQRTQTMLRSILDATVDGILVDDLRGSVLNANRRFRELWNVPEYLDWQDDGAVLLRHMGQQLQRPDGASRFDLDPQQSLPGLERGMPLEPRYELLRLRDGRVIEQHTRGLYLGGGPARIWSFRDITERIHTEKREQTRRHVLELLSTGAPLQAILASVVREVEAGNPDMYCSVLLLDPGGERLLLGAAPSLPAFFSAAMDGMAVASTSGACGETVRTASRVIVEDIRSAPAWVAYRDLALQAGLGSCWSDPIFGATGNVLGTFAVYQREARLPSLANIALVEQAARLAGLAIEQARAAAAVRVGEARFRSLYDHAPVALWEQDWSAVKAALAELARSGVDQLERYLRANPSEVRRLASLVRIVDLNAAALRQIGATPGPAGKDLAAIGLAQNFSADALDAVDGFVLALLALARGERFFSCEGSYERLDGVIRLNELTLLVMPGHTDSLDFVIVSTMDTTEKRRMHDELRVLATTDFLTGLANRREFMNRLEEEQERLAREIGARTAVLLLDLDHFKRINDEYGHAAGDAVLRQLSALMREDQRKIDMLGRLGGEEFAILLPGATLGAAAVFADRLRQRIASAALRLDDGATLTVTVSIGIAVMDGDRPGGDAALIRADQALYMAKRGGRNRVQLMDADSAAPVGDAAGG